MGGRVWLNSDLCCPARHSLDNCSLKEEKKFLALVRQSVWVTFKDFCSSESVTASHLSQTAWSRFSPPHLSPPRKWQSAAECSLKSESWICLFLIPWWCWIQALQSDSLGLDLGSLTSWLYNLGQVTFSLCATVSSSIKWELYLLHRTIMKIKWDSVTKALSTFLSQISSYLMWLAVFFF